MIDLRHLFLHAIDAKTGIAVTEIGFEAFCKEFLFVCDGVGRYGLRDNVLVFPIVFVYEVYQAGIVGFVIDEMAKFMYGRMCGIERKSVMMI